MGAQAIPKSIPGAIRVLLLVVDCLIQTRFIDGLFCSWSTCSATIFNVFYFRSETRSLDTGTFNCLITHRTMSTEAGIRNLMKEPAVYSYKTPLHSDLAVSISAFQNPRFQPALVFHFRWPHSIPTLFPLPP